MNLNKKISLSIIVPCYNIGHYLISCLSSITHTLYPHNKIEVLVIDDGSTDNITSKIVDKFAKKYPYIRAFHKINGGVCDARNYGIAHAKGKYIAFVDGDDIVPPNAYTDLMYAAQRYNSNIVVGAVRRFDKIRNVRSFLHKRAIQYNIPHTTIDRTHSLLYDTTVWNKVWKTSFIKKNHLHFIKGIIYEDLPFDLKAHLLSKNTTIIRSTVYYWRWRAGSITDSRQAIDNYKSRLHSLNLCRKILFKAGYLYHSSLYQDFIKKTLSLDLPLFLENCGDTPVGYVYQAQELTYLFLKRWHLLNSRYLSKLPIKSQILYYAVKTADLNLLKKFTYQKKIGYFHTYQLTKNIQFRAPALSQKIISKLDLKHNTLPRSQKLHRLTVDKNTHMIYGTGMFRIKRTRLVKRPLTSSNYHESLTAVLINLNNRISMPISMHRKATARYKRIFRPRTSWTNARYIFSFNYLRAEKILKQGKWCIKIIDSVDGYTVSNYLGNPQKARKMKLGLLDAPHTNLVLSNDFSVNWRLIFTVRSKQLMGSKHSTWMSKPIVHNNMIIAKVNVPYPYPVIPYIINTKLNYQVKGKLHYLKDSLYQLEIPTNALSFSEPYKTYQITLYDTSTNHKIKYLFNPAKYRIYHLSKNRDIGVYSSKFHYKITARLNALKITHYRLIHGTTLRLTGYEPHIASLKRPVTARLAFTSKSHKHRYLLSNDRTKSGQKVSISIPLLNNSHNNLMVLAGTYYLIEYLNYNQKSYATHVIYTDDNVKPRSFKLPLDGRDRAILTISVNKFHDLCIRISQPWTGFSNSRSHRAIGYSVLYPLMRLLPINRHVMVFDSYWGTQFSSNERAIYNFIQKYYPQYKAVWLFKNDQTMITGTGQRVRINSLRYWYYLAIAKYIFQNTNMPNHYYKRAGQIEVETLHGTFLKHMGFDEPHFHNASRKIQDKFARRISRWDYMIVPSKYMARTASLAFDYHKRLLPCGFPRTDYLINHDNKSYINEIKRKLHIPLDKKVVLYAPTYRKHDKSFHLNLDYLEKYLSNRYVILIRLHYFVAHSHNFYENPGFAFDVSDYPNVNDLLLVSDVLITDYSSIMFDYSYLERPMIFYAYDKKMYLKNSYRGLYLNYEQSMPGPIVTIQSNIVRCLEHYKELKKDFYPQICRFSHKYAQYGRYGNATSNVVNTILHHHVPAKTQDVDSHLIFNKMWHILKIQDFQSHLLNKLSQILPKKNIIIFDSFFGHKYSDNPKALYLYIKKHYPKYDLYWDVNKDDVKFFKEHHIPYVLRFGYKGIIKQAEAKYWIVNARRPFRWHKPKNAIVLQTWHGTPLKTIGADVSLVTMPGVDAKKYHKQVYNDNKRWDYLLAPNMYSARIMCNAFRMKPSQMMLTGYPRNDILINSNNKKTRASIKRKLHIPLDKKVVLYAPTWRDNDFVKSDEYVAHLHLNLKKLYQHYGDKIVVLIRTHYMISNHLDLSKYRNIALNVSNYPDIADLYLISDVLITDYSSVMFDYSILRRPMIFFDYDYSNYAKSTRGFYFDFRKNAPGPIVTSTNGVIKHLDAIFNGRWCLTPKYKKFIQLFDKWMDGKACQRVCKQLFSRNNVVAHTLRRPLPKQISIKDGALLWSKDVNFTNIHNGKAYANYNAKSHKQFTPIRAIQLYSVSFNKPLGWKFVEVQSKGHVYWVSKNDIIK